MRQHVCNRHTYLRRGGVQLFLCSSHVGALPHQIGRQRHRQLLRQLEIGKREGLGNALARQLARQRGQQIALHCQLLLQVGQRLFGLCQCRLRSGNV